MTFPDVVELLIAYLDPIVDPVGVHSRVPNPRPKRLIQVRRVGGTALVPVRDRARIDIMSWAPTEPEAMENAQTIRAAIWELSGTTELGVVVYRIEEVLSPRMDDDTEAGSPRAWATYDITVRADEVIEPAASILD